MDAFDRWFLAALLGVIATGVGLISWDAFASWRDTDRWERGERVFHLSFGLLFGSAAAGILWGAVWLVRHG